MVSVQTPPVVLHVLRVVLEAVLQVIKPLPGSLLRQLSALSVLCLVNKQTRFALGMLVPMPVTIDGLVYDAAVGDVVTQSVQVGLFVGCLLVEVGTATEPKVVLGSKPGQGKLIRVGRVNSRDQLVQEVLLVNLWVVDDFGDQTVLVLGAAQVHVSIVCIEDIRDSLRHLVVLLPLGRRLLNWLRHKQIMLNADRLAFHHWLWGVENFCLDVNRAGLHLFRHKALVKALAERAQRDLRNVNVDVVDLAHDRLVL